jgi:hypothetical protein
MSVSLSSAADRPRPAASIPLTEEDADNGPDPTGHFPACGQTPPTHSAKSQNQFAKSLCKAVLQF